MSRILRTVHGGHLRSGFHGGPLFFWALTLQLLCLAGCSGGSTAPSAKPLVGEDLGIQTILVSPVELVTPRGEIETEACPISGVMCRVGPIEPEAAEFLTNELFAILQKETDYTLVPPEIGRGIRYEVISEDIAVSGPELFVRIGERASVDAVVTGTLYRFRQRVGRALSVESPASVGFGIHLIRVRDGRLVWSRHFDETQQGASENLFKLKAFFRRGGKWLSAEQLAQDGLGQLMTSFPVR